METAPVTPVEPPVMSPQISPQILADGDVYAVWMNGAYFSSFDEDGFPWTRRSPHCVTRAQADEIAKKVGDHAKVVSVRADKGIAFWTYDPYAEAYSRRTLESGSPVRSHLDGIPGWFKAAMQKHSPNGSNVSAWDDEDRDDGVIAWEVFRQEFPLLYWLDHDGFSGEGEDSILVAEPYHLDGEDVQSLIEVCAKFGFKFHISGKSIHYPSHTVRIEITPVEKLTYVRPVRVISPEQKVWEDERKVVFESLIRKHACDFIEHAIHVVKDSDDLLFVKCALKSARCFLAGHADTCEEALAVYSRSAGKRRREAIREGWDRSTQMILHAVQYALGDMKNFTSSTVGILCADAVLDYESRKPDFDSFEDGTKAFQVERDWQMAHGKEEWDEYAVKWGHDYQEAA
jgi:hypothetical protein